ncbi:MutS-related protein [Nocardia macrotermitis]|uniref:DNA mismatch repair protein MutS n=1 Tax=Nocardia macrotermitis TaxID=2585198 RepID=A0A7K0D7W1_9NOCA|nr:DNA mismatch repair protein MutS [Nocardia macrotermitis]MQY21873.1 DNA mismatch repair protein MutS [Nocardia macrotermitis]
MRDFSIVRADAAAVEVDRVALTDLNIDQVLAAVLRGDAEYELGPLYLRPVRDPDVVRYRREVFADLDELPVRAAFHEFAAGMRAIRRGLAQGAHLHQPDQRRRWHLDAAESYLLVLTRLSEELSGLPLHSRGLRGWRALLAEYLRGSPITTLARDVREMRRELDAIRYSVRIVGRTVEVGFDEGATDYSAAIANLFARFGSAEPSASRAQPQWADMNQTEEQILREVARLHPGPFARLERFCAEYPDFLDPMVVRFEREIQFYLVYLTFGRGLAAQGHPLRLPDTAAPGAEIYARDAFDIALAVRPRRGNTLVCNDFQLSGPERVLLVTGPNQGGKTTFARMFGQLVYFAALGCPVPARAARLPLPDAIFTHFEHAEDPVDPDGRLLGELVRMRDTLDRVTADSVIVMNESFSSTSTSDAVRIGGDVLGRIIERGALALWVTFFEELSRISPAVVSMVAGTEDDTARRTFRIERRPADGQLHALELAGRHGLDYDRVIERFRR